MVAPRVSELAEKLVERMVGPMESNLADHLVYYLAAPRVVQLGPKRVEGKVDYLVE